MAANEIPNSNGGLTRIVFPNLDKPEFGKSLAAQFRNIDLNFQKLGNLNLGKGDDGAGCTYINYNLNSIFFYWSGFCDTTKKDENGKPDSTGLYIEKQNFWGFYNFLMDRKNPMYDRIMQLKTEVDADYEEFFDLTGGTQEDYARMCAFLLFGQPMLYDHYKKDPETCSLFGALIAEHGESSSASINGTTYSSMWLLDWWNADPKPASETLIPTYDSEDKRAKLFLTHMELFDPGRITVAVAPALDNDRYAVGNYRPVASLAYVYLDPRYRNNSTGDEVDDASQWVGEPEISCVLYWSPRPLGHMHITSNDGSWDDHTCTGGFKVVNLFPQMYFDGDGFYWKINGTETKIPVTGRPGADGKNSQFVVVERIGNIKGAVYNESGYDANSKLWGPWPLKQTTYYHEWLGKEKLIRTVHSGRAFRNEVNDAYTSAQNWISDHINVEFNTIKSNLIEIENGVASTDMVATDGGWLPDSTGFNNTELLHLHRIWGIVGRECFWRAKADLKPNAKVPFRVNDPSYSNYNFGVDDAVELLTDAATQAQMMALDGAPCIVIADPAYIYDRTNTTVWFSTLKAVKASANKDDTNIMLVAYCGDENQMTTEIDDHGMAGIMQHLDVYTYKSTGSSRNKPRGLMLPIGTAEATMSTKASDIYGSHIIHSDLGGFVKRTTNKIDDTHSEVIGLFDLPTANLIDINGDSMRANNKQLGNAATQIPKDVQFTEVFGKRFMHIGSVNDFRTLDYVPTVSADNTISPAIPGRKTDHTLLKDGLYGFDSNTPYGTAGFFGTDNAKQWFEGSELHVDEPVTITRYRDLQRRGTLLRVEGDTVIGPHVHVNFPGQFLHNRRDGGLFVQSTLSNEILEDTERIWKHSVFPVVFGEGIMPRFRNFTRDVGLMWRTYLIRSKTDDTQKFNGGYLGAWKEDLGQGYDSISNKNGLMASLSARASILADDMIGARMMLALDGIAIIDRDQINKSDMTPFSVDRQGNIQTLGSEVRSSSQDTYWAFHTRWMREGQVFETSLDGPDGEPPTELPKGFTPTTVPGLNQIMFGLNHELYKVLFDPTNGGDIDSGFHHWRCVNNSDIPTTENPNPEYANYLWYDKAQNTCRVPEQLAAGYVTNLGYATNMQTHEKFGTTFNTTPSLKIAPNMGGDLMPYMIRLWCDLLYQEGAIAVKGLHFMPVTTSFMSTNYYGRYGANIAYGIVIGKNGAAQTGDTRKADPNDPNQTTFDAPDQLKAYYSAHAQNTLTLLGADDTLGTHNVIGDTDTKWVDGDTNMFTSLDLVGTPIGLWSQTSILTEESVLAQKDLWVGRVAAVRGQTRAMSFRRHSNSWTNATDKDWAFLLDTGMSSYNAPRHDLKLHDQGCTYADPGFKPFDQTPLVLDLGYVYGKRRLVRFGSVKSVNLTADNKLKLEDGAGDREICLLGKMPNDDCVASGKFSSLFGNSKNAGTWVLYNSNGIITVLFRVFLDHTATVGHHRTWFRGNSQYQAYGIALPGDAYGTNPGRQAMLSTPIECTGLKQSFIDADLPEEWLPKDKMYVDSHIEGLRGTSTNVGKGAKLFGSNDAEAWDSTGRGGYGITFRLSSANGRLQLQVSRAFCPALMVDKPNQYLTFSFTYPTAAALENVEIEDEPLMEVYPEREIYYICSKIQGYGDVIDTETGTVTQDFARNDEGQLKQAPIASVGDILGIYGGTSEAKASIENNEYVFNNNTPALDTNTTNIRTKGYYIFSDEYEDDEILEQMNNLLKNETNMLYIIRGSYSGNKNIGMNCWSAAKYKDLDWEVYATKSDLLSSNDGGMFAQNTTTGLLGKTKTANQLNGADGGFFNGKDSRTIPDGVFRNLGKFSDASIGENGYITESKTCMPTAFTPFSVQYWEEGETSFLRLNIALDRYYGGDEDRLYSHSWGIWVPNESDAKKEQRWVEVGTNAYLPQGAKLPSYAVRAQLAGYGQNWSNWRDNRPMRGSGIFRLNADGRIWIEQLNNPLSLATGNSDITQLPVASLLFVYKSSDNTMAENKYTETGDENAKEPDAPVIPDPIDPGQDTSDGDKWIWNYPESDSVASKLPTWLQSAACNELRNYISSIEDGSTSSLSASYGSATISNNAGKISVSMIVTSYKGGSNDLSHRSINFTCDANCANITNVSTYIIGNSDDSSDAETGDITKLTTVDTTFDQGTDHRGRTKTDFQTYIQSMLQKLANANVISRATSANGGARITTIGPGGTFTMRFDGADIIQVNGYVNCYESMEWASGNRGGMLFFGSSIKVTSWSATNVIAATLNSCYYSSKLACQPAT